LTRAGFPYISCPGNRKQR